MSVSCIFLPPKETVETIGGEETIIGENGQEILTKNGLTCVWHDEFGYTGVPDTSKWKYQTGHGSPYGWGNNEQQEYTDNTTTADTASVDGQYLRIRAYNNGSGWKSARLNSKQSWQYGYIEARMKITDRPGAWPAFWMMPQGRADWPACGEIDIMENAPATCGNHTIFSSLHADGHNSATPASIGRKKFDANLSSEWHTVGVLWNGQRITAYYDDVAVGSYDNDGSGVVNWPYDQNFYIILNLAIGGNLGGDDYVGDLNGLAEFLVDYVRVYQ